MRKPYVSGVFYPVNREELLETVDRFIAAPIPKPETANATAFLAPHAGFAYSGKTAGFTYSALLNSETIKNADTIVIIGPNHTGKGDYHKPMAVSLEDWSISLGVAKNDTELSKEIIRTCVFASADETAHEEEHSIEVQLPFLHSLFDSKRFVFLCMGEQSYEASEYLAGSIFTAASNFSREVVVIASSDLDHYESLEMVKKKDGAILQHMTAMDPLRFNHSVQEVKDSACGYGPITVAMLFAMQNKAKRGILLNYSTSGDMTQDYSNVVAYASAAFA